jgi:hypothetical protein
MVVWLCHWLADWLAGWLPRGLTHRGDDLVLRCDINLDVLMALRQLQRRRARIAFVRVHVRHPQAERWPRTRLLYIKVNSRTDDSSHSAHHIST